jgi:hypothetical protein
METPRPVDVMSGETCLIGVLPRISPNVVDAVVVGQYRFL